MAFDPARLDRMLNPRSIVVVGDKAPTYGWLTRQKEFPGPVMSVQVDPKEVEAIEALGFANYSSLAEVPGDIDLVICAVPRQITPMVIGQAVERGVGGVSMFTSGFSETEDPDAIEMERKIYEAATRDGMPIVGPNCLGIYNRELGLKFSDDQLVGDGGTVAIAGQSGTNTSGMVSGMQRMGVKVRRAVSFGNALIVNECDYLEYYANDPDVEVIVMYIEGVRDGKRFLQLLRETTPKKPVVLWHGGRTPAGAKAIKSHTSSLASSVAVWDAMVAQTGAIGTATMEETVDVTAALTHTERPQGRGMALIGMNGGQAVALTDQFSSVGFDVPSLSEESYAQLAEFFVAVGSSYRNPFDAASTIRSEDENLEKILDIIASDEAIDGGVAIELGARDFDEDPASIDRILDLLDRYRGRTGHPAITLMHDNGGGEGGVEAMVRARAHVAGRGFAAFQSYSRGAAALDRVVSHIEAVSTMGGGGA